MTSHLAAARSSVPLPDLNFVEAAHALNRIDSDGRTSPEGRSR